MLSFWVRRIFGQQVLNPNAARPIRHRFAFPIFDAWTHADLQKLLDYLPLCSDCYFRAGATSPRVLHRKMKGGRTRDVSLVWISARFEQAAHYGGAARADGPM